MTHNPHRTALRGAIMAYEAEYDSAAGSAAQAAIARVQRALVGVLAVGDEAEYDDEHEVEVTTQQDLDARRDARLDLDTLRHALARALGRRTRTSGIAAAFTGAPERINLPGDDVMIDDVRTLRATADRALDAIRAAVDTRSEQRPEVLFRRLGEWRERQAAHVDLRARLVNAAGYVDEVPDDDDLVGAVSLAADRANAAEAERDRLHCALAVLAGHDPTTDVDPEALLAHMTQGAPSVIAATQALAEYRSTDPHADDTPEG